MEGARLISPYTKTSKLMRMFSHRLHHSIHSTAGALDEDAVLIYDGGITRGGRVRWLMAYRVCDLTLMALCISLVQGGP